MPMRSTDSSVSLRTRTAAMSSLRCRRETAKDRDARQRARVVAGEGGCRRARTAKYADRNRRDQDGRRSVAGGASVGGGRQTPVRQGTRGRAAGGRHRPGGSQREGYVGGIA